ncbi:MAG TPA: SDR family oxidoreductase [Ktedonobacterales bacterium]|nr:SDR family oxidoreductase [Ktedonobacterales bacterium]
MTERAEVPDLRGRVALVTGGGRGLGAAVALALAEAGADVALLGRSEPHLATVAGAVRQRGRHAAWTVAGVSNWEAVRDAIAEMSEALGPVDILVNNAAVEGVTSRLESLDPGMWAAELAINLNGPFYCARATISAMRERGWGRILNVTSGAAVRPIPGKAVYSVSKAGLDHLTRALAEDLAGSGVAAIAVNPGMMDTEMQARLRGAPAPEMEMFRQAHRSGMLRPPEEAAALIRWLCGPGGDAYSGQVVSIHAPDIRARAGLPNIAR